MSVERCATQQLVSSSFFLSFFLLLLLSVMCCTYRLQRWAASVRVARCGGATRPGAGESNWGCWDCAAASRTGCPSDLVGRGDTQPHTPEHEDQTHTTHDKDTKRRTRTERWWGGERWTRRDRRETGEEGRAEGRQEKSESTQKKFCEKQRGLWESQRVHP